MKPIFYYKISKQIEQHQLKSLTFDIFDTIILNEYWPSDLRFYDLAAKQLPLLQQSISPEITTYELFDLRRYARRLLQNKHDTLRLDTWLTELVELLLIKYPTPLTDDQQLELLANLIKLELEFTLENCKPNLPLLTQIQLLRQTYPDLKIYFTSHSYFTSAQIKLFLQIFKIDLFDNGVSAADTASGELFSQLPPSFQPATNLHIGDHYHQDFRFAKSLQLHALHYRPIRMRGLRTLIGQIWLQLLQHFAQHRAKSQANLEPNQITAKQHQILTHQIATTVSLDYNNYILAANFPRTQLGTYSNLQIFPNLTHDTLVQAFIWLLATYSSSRWNAPELLKLLFRQTPLQTRAQIYDFCFSQQYIYSQLALDSFTDAEFYQVLLNEIATAAPELTANLRRAYETTILTLPQNDKPVIFISLADDGSAELFRDFARLHNFANNFDKLILNATVSPTSVLPPSDFHYDLAPDTYLTKILHPHLKQTS